MKKGYSRTEAKALVGQSFETRARLTYVPTRTRGRVIGAIDLGDQWDVMIEWAQLGTNTQVGCGKFVVDNAMQPV